MREFFRGWRRKAGGVALVMACVAVALFVSDSKTENLTDAPEEIIAKAVGMRVKVDGVAGLDKEGEAIRTTNFSALVDLSSGQSWPRSGTKINVTGVLHANDPQQGYRYRIVLAKWSVRS